MPIQFVPFKQNLPPKNAVVACAGTVTASTVAEMGSGFNFFKNLFPEDSPYNEGGIWKGWKGKLQFMLNQYHNNHETMPPYALIAKQPQKNDKGYIGAVVTVPKFTTRENLKHLPNPSDAELEQQYKDGIEQLLIDAKSLNRPIYMQMFGIGAYGWNPEVAAKLVVEAIQKVDPNFTLNITIPIFDRSQNSKDNRFKDAFLKQMNKIAQENVGNTSVLNTNSFAHNHFNNNHFNNNHGNNNLGNTSVLNTNSFAHNHFNNNHGNNNHGNNNHGNQNENVIKNTSLNEQKCLSRQKVQALTAKENKKFSLESLGIKWNIANKKKKTNAINLLRDTLFKFSDVKKESTRLKRPGPKASQYTRDACLAKKMQVELIEEFFDWKQPKL